MKKLLIITIILTMVFGNFYPLVASTKEEIIPNQYIAKVNEELIDNYLVNIYINDAATYTNCLNILDETKYLSLSPTKQNSILSSLVTNCPALSKIGSPASLEKAAKQLNVPYSNPLFIDTDMGSLVNEYNNIKREMLKSTLGLNGLPDETVDSIEDEMCNLFLSDFLGLPVSTNELSVLNSEPLMDRPYLYGWKFKDYLIKNTDANVKEQLSTNVLEKLYSPKGYLSNYLENKDAKSFTDDEINILRYPPGWEADAFVYGLNIFLMAVPVVGSLTSKEAIQTVKPFVKDPAVMVQIIKPFSKFFTEDLPKFRSYLSDFIGNLKNPELQGLLNSLRDPYFDRSNLILNQKNALNSYIGLVDNLEKSTQIKLLGKLDRVMPDKSMAIKIFDNNSNLLGEVPFVLESKKINGINITTKLSLKELEIAYSTVSTAYSEIYKIMLSYLPSLKNTSSIELMKEIRFTSPSIIDELYPGSLAFYSTDDKILLLPDTFIKTGIINFKTFLTAIHEIIHQIRFSNNLNLDYLINPRIEEAITDYQSQIIYKNLRDKINLDQILILPHNSIPVRTYDVNVEFYKEIFDTIRNTIYDNLVQSGKNHDTALKIAKQITDNDIWGGGQNIEKYLKLYEQDNPYKGTLSQIEFVMDWDLSQKGPPAPYKSAEALKEIALEKSEIIQQIKNNTETLTKKGVFDNIPIKNESSDFVLKTNFKNMIPEPPVITSSNYFISEKNELIVDLKWSGLKDKNTGTYTDLDFILNDNLGNILYDTESNYDKFSVLNGKGSIIIKIPPEKIKSIGNDKYILHLSSYDQVLGPTSAEVPDKLQPKFSEPVEIPIDMNKVNKTILEKFDTQSDTLLDFL